ncbi:uncharacterized protein Dyak_GE21326 [Drosophila yakuba]|uniref:Uncharacterized protein n=1 Tax=Drosophila yakuba TaxID=7245 RepID=B4PGJ2_DROYA|nr:uncharacterized protein Dyak_GE21326 [Drosophila yakuba]
MKNNSDSGAAVFHMQINAVSSEWRSGSQDFQGDATTCGIMQLNECSSEQESTVASGWHCVGHGVGVWVLPLIDGQEKRERKSSVRRRMHRMRDRSAAHSNAIAALDGMSWQAETDVVVLLSAARLQLN